MEMNDRGGAISLPKQVMNMAGAVPNGDIALFITIMGIVGIIASFLPQVAEANTPQPTDAAKDGLLQFEGKVNPYPALKQEAPKMVGICPAHS